MKKLLFASLLLTFAWFNDGVSAAPFTVTDQATGATYQCGAGAGGPTNGACSKELSQYCYSNTGKGANACFDLISKSSGCRLPGFSECVKQTHNYCYNNTGFGSNECFDRALASCGGSPTATIEIAEGARAGSLALAQASLFTLGNQTPHYFDLEELADPVHDQAMDLGLRGKRALVLAASSGIGFGIAQALGAEGVRLGIVARDSKKLGEAAKTLCAESFVSADLNCPGGAKRAADKISRELGGLDILVTHAGPPPKGAFEDLSASAWLEGFQGLWLSAVEAIQVALPGMRERRWGRIILVTSVAAQKPLPRGHVSSGLRTGLQSLAQSLSLEVAADSITVNAILPGFTQTHEIAATPELVQSIPAGRLGTPAELGALAAFIASPLAGYITGQAIAVDGGFAKR